MADRLPEALRQAQEQLLSPGQRISAHDGRIRYDDTFFIRDGKASQILEPHLESVIFGHLIFPGSQERREFADRILRQPGLAAIFLIILANGSLSMMNTFEDKFLRQHPPCTHSDRDLPFGRAQAIDIFGEEGDGFLETQAKNKAIKLIEGSFGQAVNAEQCLPYLSSWSLGVGAFGIVHGVEIERGHYTQSDRRVVSQNKEALPLVRKDFDPDGSSYESFKNENHISRSFHVANPPPSIARALCSITIKFDNHDFKAASIFSEPANFDLAFYFKHERTHDLDLDERLRNLQQMLQICLGLKWLHHDEKKSLIGNYENASYIHGDLKPENIFIYHDPEAAQASQGVVFKIGDFGETFLFTRSKDQVVGHPPPSQFFRVGTYRAPEIQQGKIDTKSDVWSFGCILLLVLLYNHQDGGGPNAITAFATSRAEAKGNDNLDVFYQIKRSKLRIRDTVCTKAVTQCIKNMISSNEKRASPYANIATRILKYIQSSILVHEKSRASIQDVYEHLRNVMAVMGAGMREEQVVARATYQLEFANSLPGSFCRHSPNGRVFHYSPEQITFYDGDGQNGTHFKQREVVVTKLKWSDEVLPSSRACGISAICIVQKTAPNDPTQLSIQYLDPPKAHTPVRLAEVTRLNGVALSPKGNLLAVACDPKKQNRLHARVRMYRVSDFHVLSVPVRSITNSSDQSFASSTSVPLIETQKDQMKVGEVRDILPGGHVDLIFSKDGRTLYHAHRRRHHVVVSMWNADGLFLAQSTIKDDQINDNRIFITEIVPLYNARGFVAVTHEHYVVRCVWTAEEGWTERKFVAMPGLKTILVAEDDLTVVMLTTNDRDFLELYVGNLEDGFQPQRLVTKHRIRFVPVQDSAYLSKIEDDKLELQVASKLESRIFKYHFKIVPAGL